MASKSEARRRLDLRAGEWIEVRSLDEVLATLDERGELEALPFMPEMERYCGMRFRVSRRADKTCDRVQRSGLRRMTGVVHLEDLRCDGSSHGGCQALCLLFWKEAWLRRLADAPPRELDSVPRRIDRLGLLRAVRKADPPGDGEDAPWSCQATEAFRASAAISRWDVSHYLRDIRNRQTTVGKLAWWAITTMLYKLQRVPKTWRIIEMTRGRFRVPRVEGDLARTPRERLNLRPGEWVVVKSYEEILATLDKKGKNRGLSFDAEMVPYCGRRMKVLQRVERIIDEPTGRMTALPNDCIILQGAVCAGAYHGFCPRAIYPYWREIWLRRIDDQPTGEHEQADAAEGQR
jgi:hypothetical protein